MDVETMREASKRLEESAIQLAVEAAKMTDRDRRKTAMVQDAAMHLLLAQGLATFAGRREWEKEMDDA